MAKERKQENAKNARKGGSFAAALCNVLGMFLLVAVIGLCAPLTVPRLMGYQVYDIVSGSMEPHIAVGSAVLVKPVEPAGIVEGQVIAFNEADSVVVHRVVANRTALGEFVTKGDANNTEDLQPAPYAAFIGQVQMVVPYLGSFMAIYATTMGKVYLLLTAACGVMFNVLAGRIRASRRRALEVQALAEEMFGRPSAPAGSSSGYGPAANEANAAGAASGHAAQAAVPGSAGSSTAVSAAQAYSDELRQALAAEPAPRRRGRGVRIALAVVLGVVFLGSSGVVGFVTWQHAQSDSVFARAAELYTSARDQAAAKDNLPVPPIQVDFAALQAENPDVVGWIYCPDTPIDYPLLRGRDNDQYLHADYTGAYNIDGSIFEDADNRPGFADSNTIIYGHHMYSGSMFAELVKWADQSFYEQHPVVWILTPQQNYRVVIFSAHHANAHSTYYNIISAPGQELDMFLSGAAEDSDITISEATAAELVANAAQLTTYGSLRLDSKAHYVMLTTCAYLFDDDRYVLHGLLTPAA